MPYAEVHISSDLMFRLMVTGAVHPKTEITRGLPDDAKLLRAHYDPGSKILVLQFEVSKEVDNPVVIEAQTMIETL